MRLTKETVETIAGPALQQTRRHSLGNFGGRLQFGKDAVASGNRKRIEQERQRLEQAEEARRGSASELATKLEQVSLTFSARVGDEGKLFGSVTSSDIAHQLDAQGFQIEKRQIDLHEPIRALGVYRVPIRLHADVHPEIKVWVIKQ